MRVCLMMITLRNVAKSSVIKMSFKPKTTHTRLMCIFTIRSIYHSSYSSSIILFFETNFVFFVLAVFDSLKQEHRAIC